MKERRQAFDLLFILSLFGVFALSLFLVVMLGANSYSSTVQQMETNYNLRTSALYITEKLRQGDFENSVRVEQVGDSDALVITQRESEASYETWIFVAEGYLREVTVKESATVSAYDGQTIMALASMTVEAGDFYAIRTTDRKDNTFETLWAPRC